MFHAKEVLQVSISEDIVGVELACLSQIISLLFNTNECFKFSRFNKSTKRIERKIDFQNEKFRYEILDKIN